jgi:hypothetical protein
MATSGFSVAKFKQHLNLVRTTQGQSWDSVVNNPQIRESLSQVVDSIGAELNLPTSYEFYQALQDRKQRLPQTLKLLAENETLDGYMRQEHFDRAQLSSLMYQYQDNLAQQAEGQLSQAPLDTKKVISDLVEQQQLAPTRLAVTVAADVAKEIGAEAIPSRDQVTRALETEQVERERRLEIKSQGIEPVEVFAQKALAQVEKESKLDLTPSEQEKAKQLIAAGILVAAYPLTSEVVKNSLGEEEAELISRQQEALAQEKGLTKLQLEREQVIDRTADLVHNAIGEVKPEAKVSEAKIKENLMSLSNLEDLAEKATKNARQIHESLARQEQYYIPAATTSLTEDNIRSLEKAYHQAIPDEPLSPYASYPAAQASQVLLEHDKKDGAGLGKSLELHSRGFNFRRAIAYAKADQNSQTQLGQMLHRQPQVFRELERWDAAIRRSPAGNELARRPLTFMQTRALRLVNQFSYAVPGRLGGAIRFASNPGGWLRQTMGRRAGSYLAKSLARTAVATSVKSAILKLGVKTGIASLAARAGMAIAGGVSGPVGWAITIGIEIGGRMARPALDFVGAKSYGEVARDTTIGAITLLGSIPMLIATSVNLAALAPFAFVAAVGGVLLWYIPTINIAPILSTMVQLETAPSALNQLRPGDILPPGDVPESCPAGYPSNNRTIAQGPNTGTHALKFSINLQAVGSFPSQQQALDFGYKGLPPQEIRTTHDGQAYALGENTPGLAGFGNFVVVVAECQGLSFITAYAHLSSPIIPMGGPTPVTKGQLIGLSGSSGTMGDGHHVHYEIISKGSPFDILSWIAR